MEVNIMFKLGLGITLILLMLTSFNFASETDYYSCSEHAKTVIQKSNNNMITRDRVMYGPCGWRPLWQRDVYKLETTFDKRFLKHDTATNYDALDKNGGWY